MIKAALLPLVLITAALVVSVDPMFPEPMFRETVFPETVFPEAVFPETTVSADDDKRSRPPKRDPYVAQMEEIEECYNAIKNGRSKTEMYDELAKSARRMQFLLEQVIPRTRKKLEQLGTAKSEPEFLEAKALMVESLAHVIGLEGALLAKNPELVKTRLRKLNHVRNDAHRLFQP